MVYLRGIAQTIVSAIGGTYETVLVALFIMTWLAYRRWNRQPNPPRGILRWGIWIPMLFCLCAIWIYVSETWHLLSMLAEAGAMNEAQQQLLTEQAVGGIVKMLTMGIVGTFLTWWLTRAPKTVETEANELKSHSTSSSSTSAGKEEDAKPVHLVEPRMSQRNT